MPAITIADLDNAKADVDFIASLATSPAMSVADRFGTSHDTVANAIYKISTFNNRGAWASATAYAVKDLVLTGGTWYVAVVAHTSSTLFATDVASKWRVYQGITSGDLAADDGSSLMGHIDDGVDAVATTPQRIFRREDCNFFDYLDAGEQNDVQTLGFSAIYTAQWRKGYTAAGLVNRRYVLNGGGILIDDTLELNLSVDVVGKNSEFVIIKKYVAGGDFDGMVITDAAQQSEFSNFRLTRTSGAGTSVGIKVVNSARMLMERITIDSMGGHALALIDTGVNGNGVFSNYRNLALNNNGGDALHIDKHYASYFENINMSGNTGWGLNVVQGNSHIGKAMFCENNIAGGAQIANSVASAFEIYGESNTGPDLSLTSASTRNKIFFFHGGGVSDLSDEGTNNIVEDIGIFPMISSPTIGRVPRTSNVVGRDLNIQAGLAGPGAAGHSGGVLTVSGGDANGGTIAAGGNLAIKGGEGVHNGDGGAVTIFGGTGNGSGKLGGINIEGNDITINAGDSPLTIQNVGDAGTRFGGTHAIGTSVAVDFQDDEKCVMLTRHTSAQRLAMTGVRGMIGYDADLDKYFLRVGAGWVSIDTTVI